MRRTRELVIFLVPLFVVSLYVVFPVAGSHPLAGQSASSIDWWPMFQHDPQHTGHSMEDSPDTNRTLWIYQTGGDVVSSPAVVDGRVFVGSWDWYVYCLDYVTGVELWKQYVGGWPYSSSPAVADGVVYVGSTLEYSGKIFALNATTGSVIWLRDFDHQQRSNLNIHEGMLYIGTRGGLYALNATTGSSIWSDPALIYWAWGAPVISEGILYGGTGLNLTALDATTGTFLWTKKIESAWPLDKVSPTVAYGMVFMGTDHGTVALNATNGEIIWTYLAHPTDGAPDVSEGKLFITWRDSPGALALNATTGKSIWNCTLCSEVASSPAVAGGKVFFGTLNEKIYALNETNGEICWVYQPSVGIWLSSPAIADGKLYIGSRDGKVYAFGEPHPPTANFSWTPQTPRVGGSITFDASTSTPNGGIIVKYEWNFGDGEFAVGETVTQRYYEAGSYIITLNVTDSEGLWDVEQKQILVSPPTQPVGGEWVPIDKLQLLAPWITMASLMAAVSVSFVYARHKKKQQN